ncbi:hypothetical protein RB601_003663 [Gaeumannomyces tritici]
MVPKLFVLAATFLLATTAVPCIPRPDATIPTLPSTGAVDLPAPNPASSLKAIAIGHGIQNYTCASGSATSIAAGALAILYDVTEFYPGTPKTGLTAAGFESLSSKVLWGQNIPLNLVDQTAASPGTPEKPNDGLPPAAYGAAEDVDPFMAPADLDLGLLRLKFLGHHYFDATGTPTFDLHERSLRFSVKLKQSVSQPPAADKGVLGTGAVRWLLLNDSGAGLSTLGDQSQVYRVITAGGFGQGCSTEGAVPKSSVPYSAFYWFYG